MQTPSKGARRLNLLRVSVGTALFVLAMIASPSPAVPSSDAQAAAADAKPAVTHPGDPQNGKLVFKDQGCDKCHGSQGEGLSVKGRAGGVPSIASTTLSLPTFIELVRKPTGSMPPYGSQQVSDQELSDVEAFLRSSAAPVETEVASAAGVQDGQRLYKADGCYECHLDQGEGSRATGARIGPPRLPLSAFVSYVRHPTGAMPPYTQKVVSDAQLAQMYGFLQSVPQPPSWKTIPLLNR